nr:TrbI/VirB10 family protein [Ramlibacter alkalitolerans]
MAQAAQDPNIQGRKQAFLSEAANKPSDFYLKSLKEAALSKYELKAGGVIPGVMVSGINSDLPGQVIGQVREDVYDSVTGKWLLVPKGTRLIGSYQSEVSTGQERVLMVWQRLIFPDGSSFDLKGMQGADGQGYAGFKDQVNTHTWQLVKGALLLSLVGGVNAAVAPASTNVQTPAGAAAQAGMSALTQVGSQWASKQLGVQPTLEIRPGYTFNIIVNKDMVFPGPYNKTKK